MDSHDRHFRIPITFNAEGIKLGGIHSLTNKMPSFNLLDHSARGDAARHKGLPAFGGYERREEGPSHLLRSSSRRLHEVQLRLARPALLLHRPQQSTVNSPSFPVWENPVFQFAKFANFISP